MFLIGAVRASPLALVFALSVSVFLLTGCEKPELGASGQESESIGKSGSEFLSQSIEIVSDLVTELRDDDSSPLDDRRVTITNQKGKSIEGHIIAKDESRILFRRAIDSKDYVISIASLADADQLRMNELAGYNEEQIGMITKTAETVNPFLPEPMQSRRFFWYDTLDEARAASRRSGKPLMIVFVDKTDRDLRSMGGSFNRTILNDRSFRSFALEHCEPVQLELEGEHYDLPDGLVKAQLGFEINRVTIFPCIMIISPEGTLKARFQGYYRQGVADFIEQMETALDI